MKIKLFRNLRSTIVSAVAAGFIGSLLPVLSIRENLGTLIEGGLPSSLSSQALELSYSVMMVSFIIFYYEKLLYEIETRCSEFWLGLGLGAKRYVINRIMETWVFPLSLVLVPVIELYFLDFNSATMTAALLFAALSNLGYFFIASSLSLRAPKLYVLTGMIIGIYMLKRVVASTLLKVSNSIILGIIIDPQLIYLIPPDLTRLNELSVLPASITSAVIVLSLGIMMQLRMISTIELGNIRC